MKNPQDKMVMNNVLEHRNHLLEGVSVPCLGRMHVDALSETLVDQFFCELFRHCLILH